jgi:predicted nucleic-acid-binding protein
VIALDANVLVRLILHDDEAQARAAERLVVRARRDQTPLFVADIVLCELVWVLKSRAGRSRAEITQALDRLLRTELIVLADAGVAERALELYRAGKGDFADYLIREQAKSAEAREVVTFDRQLKGEEHFRLIGA